MFGVTVSRVPPLLSCALLAVNPALRHFSELRLALLNDMHAYLHPELLLFFIKYRWIFFGALGCSRSRLLGPKFDMAARIVILTRLIWDIKGIIMDCSVHGWLLAWALWVSCSAGCVHVVFRTLFHFISKFKFAMIFKINKFIGLNFH